MERLPVMEHFYSLQGEGAFAGSAAYFIRLGGCDVGCSWCDVKDSWEMGKHPVMEVTELLNHVKSTPAQIVVITGGEPLMHDLIALTTSLREAGFRTHLETSGAYPLSGTWDWICLSPKKFKAPLPEIIPLAQELKVIIYNNNDFEWAEKFSAACSPACKKYLQPEWGKASIMEARIVDYVKSHPEWKISLQIHKYLNIS